MWWYSRAFVKCILSTGYLYDMYIFIFQYLINLEDYSLIWSLKKQLITFVYLVKKIIEQDHEP